MRYFSSFFQQIRRSWQDRWQNGKEAQRWHHLRKINSRSGDTLVEIVIATGVIALVLITIVSVVTLSVKNASISKQKVLGTRYTQEGMDYIRQQKNLLGWDTFLATVSSGGNSVSYCLPNVNTPLTAMTAGACTTSNQSQYIDAQKIFQRQADVTITGSGPTAKVTVNMKVTWLDGTVTHTSSIGDSYAQQSITSPIVPTVSPSPSNTTAVAPTPPQVYPYPEAGSNVALGKSATQSSILSGCTHCNPSEAVDGNTDGNWGDNSVTHTNADVNSWWQVDLGQSYFISTVYLYNRTDCCNTRLTNYYVFASDNPFTSTSLATTRTQAGVSMYYNPGTAGSPSVVYVNRTARYFRVQLVGTDYLSIAEFQAYNYYTTYNQPVNLAQGKTATQSSNATGYTIAQVGPQNSVDGNNGGNFSDNTVSITNNEANPWWQVDLGSSQFMSSVFITPRQDCCNNYGNYWVFVSDNPFTSSNLATTKAQAGVSSYYVLNSGNASVPQYVTPFRSGRYVRVQLDSTNWLEMGEVQVFNVLTPEGGLYSGLPNIAVGKTATQSSSLTGYTTAQVGPQNAVDGNYSGYFPDNTVSITNNEANAWWQVDLGQSYFISAVNLFGRSDFVPSGGPFYVFVSDNPFTSTSLATTKTQAGVSAYYYNGSWGNGPLMNIMRTGRYVRIQLSGTYYLELGEVMVMGTSAANAPVNVAIGKTATQSSLYQSSSLYQASNSVDGNMNGLASDVSTSITNNEANAWWQVDLGQSYYLSELTFWGRTDGGASNTCGFYVFYSDTPFTSTNVGTTWSQPGVASFYDPQCIMQASAYSVQRTARYIRIQLNNTSYMNFVEMQAFGVPAPSLPNPLPAANKIPAAGLTASSFASGFPASNFADGNYTTAWESSAVPQQWAFYDLGKVKTLTKLIYYIQQSSPGTTSQYVYVAPPVAGVGRGGGAWTAYTATGSTTDGQQVVITFSPPVQNVRYIWLYMTQSPGNPGLYEIEPYGF